MEDIIIEKLTNIENLLLGRDRPLTFEEAAEYTSLSKSTLYKLTCSNKIPCYKPSGKRLYFSKAELEAWILTNPVKTESEIEQEANDYIINGKRGEQ